MAENSPPNPDLWTTATLAQTLAVLFVCPHDITDTFTFLLHLCQMVLTGAVFDLINLTTLSVQTKQVQYLNSWINNLSFSSTFYLLTKGSNCWSAVAPHAQAWSIGSYPRQQQQQHVEILPVIGDNYWQKNRKHANFQT